MGVLQYNQIASYLGPLLLCLAATGFVYTIGLCIYNLYFHPLARYPGPFLAKISPLWASWGLYRGRLPFDVHQLHLKYGSIVRVSPNELAFNNPDAWKDIYGHRQGRPQFQKSPVHVGSTHDIPGAKPMTMCDDDNHARQRRTISHAFSHKALIGQETVVLGYVDLLMERLSAFAKTGETINLGDWINYSTFDVIGDMAFGEPFGCLRDGMFHDWVSLISYTIKAGAIEQVTRRLFGTGTILQRLAMGFVPDLKRKKKLHLDLSKEKCLKRFEEGLRRDHFDFMYYILRANEKGNIRQDEIILNSAVFIVAGSETTAALLTGLCMWLMRSPHAYRKLTEEIRTHFSSEDEIRFAALKDLPYMNACVSEGFRIFPPVPTGFTRSVPEGGDVVAGEPLPAGTIVSVHSWATTHSPNNFTRPEEYLPERWIDPVYDSDRKDASQPFSLGPRGCIGRHLSHLELRLILAKLLWNFDMERADTASPVDIWDPDEDMKNVKAFLTWQKPPLWTKLTPVKR